MQASKWKQRTTNSVFREGEGCFKTSFGKDRVAASLVSRAGFLSSSHSSHDAIHQASQTGFLSLFKGHAEHKPAVVRAGIPAFADFFPCIRRVTCSAEI